MFSKDDPKWLKRGTKSCDKTYELQQLLWMVLKVTDVGAQFTRGRYYS